MSESRDSTQRAAASSQQPRAIIHKRILDIAERLPEASMEEIADEVSGASVALVDKVLAEYGDPSKDNEQGTEPSIPETPTDMEDDDIDSTTALETDHSPDMLSEKQRETLRQIYERPTASQADIAEALDVTPPTVSRRVNAIEGFEWDQRRAFAESVFEGATDATANTSQPVAAESDGGHVESNGHDADRTDETSTEIADDSSDADTAQSAADDMDSPTDEQTATVHLDADLAHKLIHAAIESDRVTEDEERYLLGELITNS